MMFHYPDSPEQLQAEPSSNKEPAPVHASDVNEPSRAYGMGSRSPYEQARWNSAQAHEAQFYAKQDTPLPQEAAYMPSKRHWTWIVASVVGCALLLGIACSVFITRVGSHSPAQRSAQLSGPALVATEYYHAIKNRDDNKAFTYLNTYNDVQDDQQTEQELFTFDTSLADSTKGYVTNFTVKPDSSNPALITVRVTRQKNGGKSQSYNVHLSFTKVGHSWKIVTFDNV